MVKITVSVEERAPGVVLVDTRVRCRKATPNEKATAIVIKGGIGRARRFLASIASTSAELSGPKLSDAARDGLVNHTIRQASKRGKP